MSDPTHSRDSAVRLSNRQYCLLKYLDDARGDKIGLDEISHLNQGTLGANKRRGWLQETDAGDGVKLTAAGKYALESFKTGDFMRKVARMKFSSFLTLEVYDETREKKRAAKKKRG